MRGADVTQERLFSCVAPEDFVPQTHPLRPIREIVNAALREMDGAFAATYAATGRESIPPAQLLRGLLLQALYGLRSERLIAHEVMHELFERVLERARAAGLLGAQNFSVYGTLIRAWASQRSVVPKDDPSPATSGSARSPEATFKGTKRSNDAHQSRTDPDARLATKSSKTADFVAG